MGYTEAALVLILSTSSGEILNAEIVRTFVQDWHCVAFKLDPKYDKHLQQHGIDYWLKNKEYAQPGYTISFRCKNIGPYYTA